MPESCRDKWESCQLRMYDPHHHSPLWGSTTRGPIPNKWGNPHKPTLIKAYVAVFVCFATKAIHLELITNLRTDIFLASLHLFIRRRGMPHCIYSDNGTNFVGAQRELAELYAFLQKQATEKVVADWTSVRGIEWQFSPSRAPHFGSGGAEGVE